MKERGHLIAPIIVLMLAVALEDYRIRPVPWVWRIIIGLGALLASMPGTLTDVIGRAVAAVAVLTQLLGIKRAKSIAQDA